MKVDISKKLEKQIQRSGAFETAHEFADYRDTWRVFRIMAELVEGYNFLSALKREVTVFGSARFAPQSKYYKEAVKMGELLASGNFTVITGGGPGIMEAANKGAYVAEGESVGLNIQLPFEQRINPYVKKSIAFYYFFTRKVMLTSPARAFVFFPGGYGTMDEFFEVVDLMDQGMICKSPVILVGRDFWQPVLDFLKTQCGSVGSVTEDKIKEWYLVDSAEEGYKYIKNIKDEDDECDVSVNNFHYGGNIDWKIFRVMAELVEGFEFVTGLENAVTVLGTKTLSKDNRFYQDAYNIGKKLAKKKFAVVTGAKFGTAEAANKGAFEGGGISLGIGLNVVGRREVNPYLTKSIMFDFPFTRKLVVTAPTNALVFFPGGLGSMHHLFEVLTLIQTKKIRKIPVILYGKEFWSPLVEFIKKMLAQKMKSIKEEDARLFTILDNVDDVIEKIEKNKEKNAA